MEEVADAAADVTALTVVEAMSEEMDVDVDVDAENLLVSEEVVDVMHVGTLWRNAASALPLPDMVA